MRLKVTDTREEESVVVQVAGETVVEAVQTLCKDQGWTYLCEAPLYKNSHYVCDVARFKRSYGREPDAAYIEELKTGVTTEGRGLFRVRG